MNQFSNIEKYICKTKLQFMCCAYLYVPETVRRHLALQLGLNHTDVFQPLENVQKAMQT